MSPGSELVFDSLLEGCLRLLEEGGFFFMSLATVVFSGTGLPNLSNADFLLVAGVCFSALGGCPFAGTVLLATTRFLSDAVLVTGVFVTGTGLRGVVDVLGFNRFIGGELLGSSLTRFERGMSSETVLVSRKLSLGLLGSGVGSIKLEMKRGLEIVGVLITTFSAVN